MCTIADTKKGLIYLTELKTFTSNFYGNNLNYYGLSFYKNILNALAIFSAHNKSYLFAPTSILYIFYPSSSQISSNS